VIKDNDRGIFITKGKKVFKGYLFNDDAILSYSKLKGHGID
jgi:hypothetical protein